jgi:hypothetical protein
MTREDYKRILELELNLYQTREIYNIRRYKTINEIPIDTYQRYPTSESFKIHIEELQNSIEEYFK